MEEMVSTEALENEILDDARKKGERLLREAEAEARRISLDSEAKTTEALELLAADYRSRAERYGAENRARLPLEKGRMKASYIDALLKEACGAYLAAFDKERLSSTVAALLARGSGLAAGKDIEASYRGLSEKDARTICAQALPGARLVSLKEDGKLPAPGLLVATGDGALSIRATIDLVGERLLDEKRGELAAALCAEALAL